MFLTWAMVLRPVNPDHVKFLLTQFMKSQPSITFDESDTLISIVGLGSNQDSRNVSKFEIIRKAINSLEELSSRPSIISSFYESEPEFCPPDSQYLLTWLLFYFCRLMRNL